MSNGQFLFISLRIETQIMASRTFESLDDEPVSWLRHNLHDFIDAHQQFMQKKRHAQIMIAGMAENVQRIGQHITKSPEYMTELGFAMRATQYPDQVIKEPCICATTLIKDISSDAKAPKEAKHATDLKLAWAKDIINNATMVADVRKHHNPNTSLAIKCTWQNTDVSYTFGITPSELLKDEEATEPPEIKSIFDMAYFSPKCSRISIRHPWQLKAGFVCGFCKALDAVNEAKCKTRIRKRRVQYGTYRRVIAGHLVFEMGFPSRDNLFQLMLLNRIVPGGFCRGFATEAAQGDFFKPTPERAWSKMILFIIWFKHDLEAIKDLTQVVGQHARVMKAKSNKNGTISINDKKIKSQQDATFPIDPTGSVVVMPLSVVQGGDAKKINDTDNDTDQVIVDDSMAPADMTDPRQAAAAFISGLASDEAKDAKTQDQLLTDDDVPANVYGDLSKEQTALLSQSMYANGEIVGFVLCLPVVNSKGRVLHVARTFTLPQFLQVPGVADAMREQPIAYAIDNGLTSVRAVIPFDDDPETRTSAAFYKSLYGNADTNSKFTYVETDYGYEYVVN